MGANKRQKKDSENETVTASEDSAIHQIAGALDIRKQYRQLNYQSIVDLLTFFDTDINVRTAFNIRMDALLAGSILFVKKKNERKFSTFADSSSIDSENWYAQTYSQFCREVVRMLWTVGFCPCTFVPDAAYVARPIVLSVEHVDILYRNDAYGQPQFLYYEKDELTPTERKPMPNVHTFFWPDCIPTRYGELRSYMTALIPDTAYEETLQVCDMMATIVRSNPPLVSEQMLEKYDTENIGDGINRNRSLRLGGGAAPEVPTESTVDTKNHAVETASEVRQVQATLALMNANNTNKLQSIFSNRLDRRYTKVPLPEYKLDTNRHYVKHILAEGPGELMLKAQLQRTERVMTLLGVPMAMLTESSSTKGRRALSESSMQLFNNSQRLLKQQLISYMSQMYSMIYSWKHATEFVVNSKDDEVISEKEIEEATKVDIMMPGLPTDEQLEQLWMSGALKYEAYKKLMSVKTGIPLDQFEQFQKLDIKDLNGIKPESETSR